MADGLQLHLAVIGDGVHQVVLIEECEDECVGVAASIIFEDKLAACLDTAWIECQGDIGVDIVSCYSSGQREPGYYISLAVFSVDCARHYAQK